MTTFHQKHQILSSLDAMDPVQTEKVLAYIKAVLNYPTKETAKNQIKSEALKQIRQALREGQ